jgi:hypothetical protein
MAETLIGGNHRARSLDRFQPKQVPNRLTPFGPAKQEANGDASAGKSIRLLVNLLESRFMKMLIPSAVFAFLLSLAVV